MNDAHTGPMLAEALGGTFDFDNGTVRFADRDYFVRCTFTGRVGLVLGDGRQVPVGRMSEGVDTLRREVDDALAAEGLPGPWREIGHLDGAPGSAVYISRLPR